MEAGTNLVAVVEGHKVARVSVTVVDTPVPNPSLDSRTPISTSKPLESQKLHVASTAKIEKVKQPINNGIQICDDRFVSSYQVAHCHVTPTSPPLVPIEFPQLLSAPKTRNGKRRRVTRDPDYFVDSLRKYPKAFTDIDSSSELIERVLSASLSKRVNKERFKHSVHRSKCTKENASKIIQTYTRSRKETKNNDSDGNHILLATSARHSSSPTTRNQSLRDASPRLQRMGRVAEIRYLTDVRKCIRDAIKHVWKENETVSTRCIEKQQFVVCPNIQERFVLHQQQHHNPSRSKDEISQTTSKKAVAQESPNRWGESKICPICQNILPCHCRRKGERTITDDVTKRAKLDNQSPKDVYRCNSCCRNCQEKIEYKMKVYNQVFEWMQQIPFDANCSCDDKLRRLSLTKKLINSLVEFRGMKSKQKEAIKKYLDMIPMWKPTDQLNRDLYLNTFIENLVARLDGPWNDYSNLKEIISNWINERLINKMPNKDNKTKDQILYTIINRIKTLKLDEIPEKDKKLLEQNVKDILKDIPLNQTSDVDFLDRAANSLVKNITVTLPTDNSTIKSASKIDDTNTTIKLGQENHQLSNYSLISKGHNISKFSYKFDIDKQISFNNLDNSVQYYKFNKHTQTSDPIDLIVGNKEELIEMQTIRDYVENKLSHFLEELPLNMNTNIKEDLKNEIIKIISQNMPPPSSRINKKTKYYDSANTIGANIHSNHSVLLSKLPITQEQNIQGCIEKQIASVLNYYGIENKKQNKTNHELTDLLTDQIMRGNDPESVKNTACSILRDINISESQAEELCNTILHHVKNISLIQQNSPVHDKNLLSHQYKRELLDKTEKEIIHFIKEVTGLDDPDIKQNILKSIKILAKDIENLILSTTHSPEDKEKLISNKVFNFFKREIFPTDETLHMFAKILAKRLLLIPIHSSTPKVMKNDYTRNKRVSPTLSIYRQDDEENIMKDESLQEINENIYLDILSNEISKWIEKIPSDYKLPQDTLHHKMLANEIARKVLTQNFSPSMNSDSVLNREIQQWLLKIIKESNQSDIQYLTEDVKKTIMQTLQSDIVSIPKSSDNHNYLPEKLKHIILDWLRKTQMFQNRNMQENLLWDSFVSNLARDIYNIIQDNVSAKNSAKMDEQMLQAIQTRIKQFTVDPELKYNEKYNHEMSHQLLNLLKNLYTDKETDALIEEINEKSKLALISNEVFRWIENVPSDYKVSHDKYHHKMLAQEIAKKVALISTPSANYDSFLDREISQWLPKVIKSLIEVDLKFVARDLKDTVKQKNPSVDVLVPKSQDSANNLTEELKENILNWIKATQIHRTENMHENLASNLANELNDIICTSNSTDKGNNKGELMMKTVQRYIKQMTVDPKLKHNEKYNHEMAFQLLNYLTKLPYMNYTLYENENYALFQENNEKLKLGVISNEVFKWIENIPSDYRLSHDKGYMKMLAKEISKRLQTPTSNPNLNFDLFLEHEILLWLPKILKNLNEADLHLVAQDLKEVIKQSLPADVISIWKFSDNPNEFTENLKDIIISWLQNIQLYKKGDSQEELFKKSLVSNLAKDLNDIISVSSSTDSAVNKDELMMKAIETRIKQFTMDPKSICNVKYNREAALELLKLLKQLPFDIAIKVPLEKPNENTKLGVISKEILKWIENVPSDYKVSSDIKHHTNIAKEIAKRVQTLTSNSLLELELFQWLPKIIKYSNEAELQFMTKSLKKMIKRKLAPEVISLLDSPRSGSLNNLTDTLKGNILDWLKNTQVYTTRNIQEKKLLESLVSDLAKDLNDILCDKNYNDSDVSNDELMLNAIQTCIKKFPMEPKLKYNDKHHRKMALEILNYINNLRTRKRSSVIKEKLKSTIYKWLHNLPLTSTPDYQNVCNKLYSIFSVVLESKLEDLDTENYLKNKINYVLQNLPLNEEFRSYDKIQTLADNLIKSLKYELKNMNIVENLPDEQTNINTRESTVKHAAMNFDHIPVTNNQTTNQDPTYEKKLYAQHSYSNNISKRNDSPHDKLGHIEPNFKDNTDAANTIVKDEEISHRKFVTGKQPVDFEDQYENTKIIEEIKERLTIGFINILDKSNLNSNLVNGAIDENILKHDIENLINALSKNSAHKKYLLPLKQDVANVTKEIVDINKKLLAEKDLKNLLHGLIDETLPQTSHFSKLRTSFEDLKEKLIDAFINLNKASNINTDRYKEDLKKEVNKFCHDYLQRFPAAPVNADELCEDLYTVLQNVSYPKDKSVGSQFGRNNVEYEVGRFLNELPLQDNKKNNTLKREFIKSLLNHLSDLNAENYFLKNDTNLERLIGEKLKQFSFISGEPPDIQELIKDIIHRLECREVEKKDENMMRQLTGQYSDTRGSEPNISPGLYPIKKIVQRLPGNIKHQAQTKTIVENNNIGVQTDQTSEFEISVYNSNTKLQKRDDNVMRILKGQDSDSRGLQPKTPPGLSSKERNVQRIPGNIKLQAQTVDRDNQRTMSTKQPQTTGIDENNKGSSNVGDQIDMTSEFDTAVHSLKSQLPVNSYKGIDIDRTSIRPASSIQNLGYQNLIKDKIRRPNEITNQEVSPRIVIKEYHWDSTPSSQLDNTKPEAQIKQSQLRRTVPSLPLAENKIALAPLEHPKQQINRNPRQRTYSQWPYRLNKSAKESNHPTMLGPINRQPLETEPTLTRITPDINDKNGRSKIWTIVPTNVGEHESSSARASEPKRQRRKFCNDQFTECNRSNYGCAFSTYDPQHNEKISKYGTISRNCERSIPTNFDLGTAAISQKDRKHRMAHSCCTCLKDKSKELKDKVIDISNQRTANLAQCEKCRGSTCPHPSYFYFK